MGNVVVTVVKYSMLCVYSMSIQPISKLYLLSLTRSSFLSLKQRSISIRDQNLVGHSQGFGITFEKFVLTNAALH